MPAKAPTLVVVARVAAAKPLTLKADPANAVAGAEMIVMLVLLAIAVTWKNPVAALPIKFPTTT